MVYEVFKMEYSIVIPVYNSGKWLNELVDRIDLVLGIYQQPYEIILINDCSPNIDVWPSIQNICEKKDHVVGINLLYNCGQFITTVCGLDIAKGKYVVTMDDDLQHPPEELPKLIETIKNGDYDCVFGVYDEVKQKGYRRLGSYITNKIISKLYKRPKNIRSNSLRIMTNDLAKTIVNYKSIKPQISPIIFICTKRLGNVTVEHHRRTYGTSGYNLRSLIKETWNSIINVSTLPLDIVSIIGLNSSIIAFIIGIYYAFQYFLGHIAVAGFTAQILIIVFFGGLILFSIGILGKYIERMIKEITGLPRYMIKDSKNLTKEKGEEE